MGDADTTTYTVYAVDRDAIEKSLAKANRRARRAGLAEYGHRFDETDPEYCYDEFLCPTRVVRDDDGRELYRVDTAGNRVEPYDIRQRLILTVTGLAPALPGGWELLGTVTEDEAAGPVVQLFTDRGEEVAETRDMSGYQDRETWNNCDHCNRIRSRNRVFLLINNGGEITRVGSTCMSAFLGIKFDATGRGAIRMKKELDEFEIREYVGGPADSLYRITDVLAISYAEIRDNGWTSREDAHYSRKPATVDEVKQLVTGRGLGAHVKRLAAVDSVDAETVTALWDYARGMSARTMSAYAAKVSTVANGRNGLVSFANIGILASSVLSKRRDDERQAKERLVRDSAHVGEIGQRLEFPALTVMSTRTICGAYGETQIVTFATPDGDVVKWFNSGRKSLDEGKVYTVVGTVKAHGEFRGVKETVLTRCRVAAG